MKADMKKRAATARRGFWPLLVFCVLLLCAYRQWEAEFPRLPGAEDVLSLTVAVNGQKPTAADFLSPAFSDASEKEGTTVSFAENPDFSQEGERQLTLCLTGKNGRTAEVTATCTVIRDVTPPTFSGIVDRSATAGEGVALRTGVEVADDCFGTVEWRVENGNLDLTKPGYYQVFYVAADSAGNTAKVSAYVTVYEYEITEETVRQATEPLLREFCRDNASREDICRAVYAFVQNRVEYFVISDKSDYVRAGYDALFGSGRGDCFSYYAAARLLLERCGVEVLPIQRTAGKTPDTHYWLLCNLAAPGETPRWYHLDATPLDEAYGAQSGCLLTDAQLAAYSEKRPHFYDYDITAYPASATAVLTEGLQ